MIRYLSLVVLGLVVAGTPIWASPALAPRHAASEPTPLPLTYRAEIRSFVRSLSPTGETGPSTGEIRTTRWYRSPNLYRSESTQWAVTGFAKNLAGAPLFETTVVWGPDQQWLASSGANRPDADVLGYPLEPQRVTITPRSILPSTAGNAAGSVPMRDRKSTDAPLGLLGQCYEPPQLVEHGTVAGQPVNVFAFRRRSGCTGSPGLDIAGSAARRISIDTNTGVRLKDEALDMRGMPIPGTTTEMTEIHYGVDLPDSLFDFQPARGAVIRHCPDLQCATGSQFPEQSDAPLPDYTVVTLHGSITNDRTDYFAGVELGGSRRDIPLSRDCYERIRRARFASLPNTLSTIVPRECRS